MRQLNDIESELVIDQLGLTDNDYKHSSDVFWSIMWSICLMPLVTIAMIIAFQL